VWQDVAVTPGERAALLGQGPFVLWFTGLSGAGKSALSRWLSRRLHDDGLLTYVLDGDNLRHGLNGDLGFSVPDRRENVRRLAHVAGLMCEAGLITLVACISPFQAERDFARSLVGLGKFLEVFVDTPLALCEERDTKGLYRRARLGEITDFTGIDSPYERPTNPDITIETANRTVSECGAELTTFLHGRKLLTWPARS
jgi:bifunctional enzyme CysN/CysC